ncbi:MAG: hypothetical protein GF364_20465 [Candidatus Lokiarchaeota archaeon]|nr:hypothetical protein [Candidatus Lokiarchaeota archaeon]
MDLLEIVNNCSNREVGLIFLEKQFRENNLGLTSNELEEFFKEYGLPPVSNFSDKKDMQLKKTKALQL